MTRGGAGLVTQYRGHFPLGARNLAVLVVEGGGKARTFNLE